MKEQVNSTQIMERTMRECFEEIGIPHLSCSQALENPISCQERLIVHGIRFTYEKKSYGRAIVEAFVLEDIPAEKVYPLKELINLINTDLGCDHFYYVAEINALMFATALHVYGDYLPRDKFKKLLTRFLWDLYRYLPVIETLLVKGGTPSDLMKSHRDHEVIGLDTNRLNDRTDYTKLRKAIKSVFLKRKIPVSEVGMAYDSIFLVSHGKLVNCQVGLTVFTLNHTGQLYLQILCPEALPESKVPDAMEMANIINSQSYANHFYVLPRERYLALASGVLLDRKLDEKELEDQLEILIVTARECLPVFMGGHPANVSALEHLKDIMARASA